MDRNLLFAARFVFLTAAFLLICLFSCEDKTKCVDPADDVADSCDAALRAFDSCDIVAHGMYRDNAIDNCEKNSGHPYWECIVSCYRLYLDCWSWEECEQYCDSNYSENATDDDTWWDDDTWDDDDDDFVATDCETAMVFLYEICAVVFTDEDNQEIPVDNLITWCEDGMDIYPSIAECVMVFQPDCDEIINCITNLLSKGGAQ